MTALDVAFLALGAVVFSPLLFLVGILRRWIVPGWAFADKMRESDDWRQRCDDATRLASQATTIAEHLSRSVVPTHLNEKPAP